MAAFDFIAVDFETATAHMDSACAIGIVAVKDLEPVEDFYSLIKPPRNEYSEYNTGIHGITPEMTADALTLTELWPQIKKYFSPHIPVVAHNAQFDMSVLQMATGVELPDLIYLDSMTLASHFVEGSLGLLDCASQLGIKVSGYEHHDARDDATLCSYITIACLCGLHCDTVYEYIARTSNGPHKQLSELKPIKVMGGSKPHRPKPQPGPVEFDESSINKDGPLAGKSIVFTGELSVDRTIAEAMAACAGAIVKTTVSKKISYLVVGQQLYTDGGKSGKEKKAEELNASGAARIETLTEDQFMAMIRCPEK